MVPEHILEVEDLHTHFFTKEGVLKALNGVTLRLRRGGVLGLLGESGAGKSLTALSILRIVPYPGKIVQGKVLFEGRDLLDLEETQMRAIRGREISLVFQDPVAGLNPMLDVGSQVGEVLQEHLAISRRDAREEAKVVLTRVGLPNPTQLVDMYPFQLSGGMAQRVMIGMALALNPKLIIADEPTAALDVTIQAQILEFLKRLRRERDMSILLISHDLGVMASMAEEVAVIYAGTVIELADTRTLYRYPAHPYSWGLMQSLPQADLPRRRLHTIAGIPPSLMELPDQCPFLPRCHKAVSLCRTESRPPLQEVSPGQWVACYNPMVRVD